MSATVTKLKLEPVTWNWMGKEHVEYEFMWPAEFKIAYHHDIHNSLNLISQRSDLFRFKDKVDLNLTTTPNAGLKFRCNRITDNLFNATYEFVFMEMGQQIKDDLELVLDSTTLKMTIHADAGLYNFQTCLYVTPKLV